MAVNALCAEGARKNLRLHELVQVVPGARVYGDREREILGVTHDSRQVKPGYVFVAIRGFSHDGREFIPQALSRGAAAIVQEQAPAAGYGSIPAVDVQDARLALAFLAAQFYDHPSRKLRVVGVTGTNGKTTTTFLVKWILESWGHRVGLVGTVQNMIGDQVLPGTRTTPEATELQELLARMVAAGCSHVVMEVSSHALALARVSSCEFDVAVLTNVTQDHLDFHKTFEDYWQTKARLFEGLGRPYLENVPAKPNKLAVLNFDDHLGPVMAGRTAARVVSYGLQPGEDVRLEDLHVATTGIAGRFLSPWGEGDFQSPLTGRFNAYNNLAAMSVALWEGVGLQGVLQAVKTAPGVPGRFERVYEGEFTVVVDYAHTPDGLENVLRTARQLAQSHVICVFGAGGDRDRGKRPLMGEVVGRLADYAVITSDNPRSEDPEAIIAEIVPGFVGAAPGKPYKVEVDRRRAINHAVSVAGPGDLVLIAGKGHETYQEFDGYRIDFDDRVVAREALEERFGGGRHA